MPDPKTATQEAGQTATADERSYKCVVIPYSDRAHDYKHIEAFGFFAGPWKNNPIEEACILYKWELIPGEKGKFLSQTEARYKEMLQQYRNCYGGYNELMRAPNSLLAAVEKKKQESAAEAENKKRAEREQAG